MHLYHNRNVLLYDKFYFVSYFLNFFTLFVSHLSCGVSPSSSEAAINIYTSEVPGCENRGFIGLKNQFLATGTSGCNGFPGFLSLHALPLSETLASRVDGRL